MDTVVEMTRPQLDAPPHSVNTLSSVRSAQPRREILLVVKQIHTQRQAADINICTQDDDYTPKYTAKGLWSKL